MAKRAKAVHHGSSGSFYFVGGIGAAIYYIQQANTAGEVIFGILKSIVWPAFLIHGLLKFLQL